MLVNMRTQFARPPRKKDEKRGADRFFRGAPRPDKKNGRPGQRSLPDGARLCAYSSSMVERISLNTFS